MTRKVAAVHGQDEPRLLEVRQAFESFQAEMVFHTNEDEIVFPAVRQLESADGQGCRCSESQGYVHQTGI